MDERREAELMANDSKHLRRDAEGMMNEVVVPDILSAGAEHAAYAAYREAILGIAHPYTVIEAIFNAAIERLIRQGNAEFCKSFAWSDGEGHAFGNGEGDLHDVIVIKVQK